MQAHKAGARAATAARAALSLLPLLEPQIARQAADMARQAAEIATLKVQLAEAERARGALQVGTRRPWH